MLGLRLLPASLFSMLNGENIYKGTLSDPEPRVLTTDLLIHMVFTTGTGLDLYL